MTIIDWSGALDRLFKLLQVRKTARKALLDAEFSSFTSDVLEAQAFFIDGLDSLRKKFAFHAKRAEELLRRNDSAEAMKELCSDIDALISEIDDKRHQGRADRMALSEIAKHRATKGYFENSVLQVISEEERLAFKGFYEAVGEVFGHSEALYYHELASGLRIAQASLDRISCFPMDLTDGQKHKLLAELVNTKKLLEGARDMSQSQYAGIKTLHDKISSSLQSF